MHLSAVYDINPHHFIHVKGGDGVVKLIQIIYNCILNWRPTSAPRIYVQVNYVIGDSCKNKHITPRKESIIVPLNAFDVISIDKLIWYRICPRSNYASTYWNSIVCFPCILRKAWTPGFLAFPILIIALQAVSVPNPLFECYDNCKEPRD